MADNRKVVILDLMDKIPHASGSGDIDDNRKVVILVSPTLEYVESVRRHAARIKGMGLTGYGDNDEQALKKVRLMLSSWVNAHRMNNDLVEWLDRSGVEWYWDDEFQGDRADVYAIE